MKVILRKEKLAVDTRINEAEEIKSQGE